MKSRRGSHPIDHWPQLNGKSQGSLGLPATSIFRKAKAPAPSSAGFTLAQKMVGRACGVEGIRPGQYCEPKITTVGSQDTTGGMTRDELTDLACLGFSADLVMQSFAIRQPIPNLSMLICMRRCRSLPAEKALR
jgi:aconitate hydratase 2/2-methylisocitrate dehydratase